MNIQSLQTFQIAARKGSFLAAAEELLYAQSTVTLHIKQLEAEWGVELFERAGKRVRLTEAGRVLLEQVEHVLDQLESLNQTVSGLSSGYAGHIRLGCIEPTASIRLAPFLSQFCSERPGIRLRLEIGGTDGISERVLNGDLDLGICSPPNNSTGLTFEPLFAERMRLLVPTNHPLEFKDEISVADLAASKILLTEPSCAYRRITEKVFLEHGINPYSGIQISSLEAIGNFVKQGLGVAVYPEIAPIPEGTYLKPFSDIQFELSVGIVRRQDHAFLSPVLEAFLNGLYKMETK